ncbi:helix-turn-helix domain-containing protein [Streptomyces sp. NPDC088736]|uniref:helix-turn-helix domain-containing protein n=1 Tax=Streptomyces sp. NPDC088736 TaxID=3365881 RepID=UPI00381E9D2A
MATGRIEMGPTARTVAANLRRVREQRGMTLRELSAELKKIGRNLSADGINKIENGRLPDSGEDPGKPVRRADVDDLVALALVLNVSPLTLLLPPTSGTEPVELAERYRVTSETAWGWAEGRLTAIDKPDDSQEENPEVSSEYQRKQAAYDALTFPEQRRRFESLPGVLTARRLYETVTELTRASSDAAGREHSRTAQQSRAAARRHQQLGIEIDELTDSLRD